MTVNEKIVSSYYRRLIDKSSKLWQRISFWTKSSDVEFNDGKTAEQKVGNINGITSDFSINDESICASSHLTHTAYERFDEFTDGGKIVSINIGEDGKPYIKYWDGTDTVLKKLGDIEISEKIADDDILLKTSGSIKGANYAKKGVTITQEHINEGYKFYVANITSAGAFYAASSGIDTGRCDFGIGAIKIYSGNASASSSDPESHPGCSGNIKTLTYIIPPQEAGTELKIYIRGIYSINIFGIK